ncbi:MAG TPA: threonine-phosphate decarboxylase CobD [Noviherbaspirillum sp.]|nr:threonine-phosphate decarboxylase CobD [Noviherbaspirillum sp.]
MIAHGGNLREAATRYGRPLDDWIDLSTGINPNGYPVPTLGPDVWHRLPEPDPELVAAACACYGAPALLPVAGTQAAIQALPRLRRPGRVVVSSPSYAEHAHCWAGAGHAVHEARFDELEGVLDDCDVMVVCNPNNPTGATVEAQRLLDWSGRLANRGAWLVVDEAFGEVAPALTVAPHAHRPGLIVLRSVGKFFGLAGLRLGFVAAHDALLDALSTCLGPWSVSTPAQQIGKAALSDRAWQGRTREALLRDGMRLHTLLARHGIATTGTALFRYWPYAQAAAFQQHMARHGVWVRRFDAPAQGVRLGLPGSEAGWQRLETALAAWARMEHAA